jgi:hypothetical protein
LPWEPGLQWQHCHQLLVLLLLQRGRQLWLLLRPMPPPPPLLLLLLLLLPVLLLPHTRQMVPGRVQGALAHPRLLTMRPPAGVPHQASSPLLKTVLALGLAWTAAAAPAPASCCEVKGRCHCHVQRLPQVQQPHHSGLLWCAPARQPVVAALLLPHARKATLVSPPFLQLPPPSPGPQQAALLLLLLLLLLVVAAALVQPLAVVQLPVGVLPRSAQAAPDHCQQQAALLQQAPAHGQTQTTTRWCHGYCCRRSAPCIDMWPGETRMPDTDALLTGCA